MANTHYAHASITYVLYYLKCIYNPSPVCSIMYIAYKVNMRCSEYILCLHHVSMHPVLTTMHSGLARTSCEMRCATMCFPSSLALWGVAWRRGEGMLHALSIYAVVPACTCHT